MPIHQQIADANTIEYTEDPLVWHWSGRNRPVRCTTSLTVYRNTTRNGVTVTDTGLEVATSYKDVFGAHASRGDVNFVSRQLSNPVVLLSLILISSQCNTHRS